MASTRKKLDVRFKTVIENGIIKNHRSLFVIVGDKGRDQIPILYHIMTKARVQSNPDVLWAYKKDLGFSSNRKKRMKEVARKLKNRVKEVNEFDPFEVFLVSTKIRYCYYNETYKILGQTFGMCIIQDFEAVTPNILARTVETVMGGGIVVVLLRTVKSLRQLYTMSMDVHDRYRTESHQDVIGRFNERFILSLPTCKSCLVIDDQLNILPISSQMLNIEPLPLKIESLSAEDKELNDLKNELLGDVKTQLMGSLIACCLTLDQGKAVLQMIDSIVDKSLRNTVAVTASRGRGKSAALGLSIAAAVAFGYSNIFVTAPSPENLKTVFEFICKGFDALKYTEHQDYDLIQSLNPEFNRAVIRINVFREHRQTIQYLDPNDHEKLSQTELLCIDEAAAIPLTTVAKLFGPYLILISSTINGYEGTGRSLSLKLLSELRSKSSTSVENGQLSIKIITEKLKKINQQSGPISIAGRSLIEIKLKTSIRYGSDDPVESWLSKLLCLNIDDLPVASNFTCPHPNTCQLYYVNRDTLFSFHEKTEEFLQRLIAIFVASHYKNSPDDLQMMSDAPAHHIFCLLPPNAKSSHHPDILCAIQIALEGDISKESIANSLRRGIRGNGDMIPWVIEREFGEREFARKSGARIVRVATHPNYQRMGYGLRALILLEEYFEGRLRDLSLKEEEIINDPTTTDTYKFEENNLLEEQIQARANLPPLMVDLSRRTPEMLDYIGVSYGATVVLLQFWKKYGMLPVYMAQNQNSLTGENSCIMLKMLHLVDGVNNWLQELYFDFRKRFIRLLYSDFQKWKPSLALAIISNKHCKIQKNVISESELYIYMTKYDIDRLVKYSHNLVDYRQIKDLLPILSQLYFEGKINLNLNVIRSAILVGLGLQGKQITDLSEELDSKDKNFPANQILAILNSIIKNFVETLDLLGKKELDRELDLHNNMQSMEPFKISLDDELIEAADKEFKKQKLIVENFGEYEIRGREDDWQKELAGSKIKSIVSIKSTFKKRKKENQEIKNKKFMKFKNKNSNN